MARIRLVAGGLSIAALLLFYGHLLSGCGPTAIQTQARFAYTFGEAHRGAGQVIDEQRTAALDRVEHATEGQPLAARRAALEAEAGRWRPVGQVLDTARTVLLGWVSSISIAVAAGSDADLLPPIAQLAARLIQLYDRIAELGRELGVQIPALPPPIRTLVDVVGGR